MKIKIRFLSFLLCVLSSVLSADVRASELSAEVKLNFKEANVAYQSADYEQAQKLYLGIMEKGFISSSLLYNLGNVYVKTNRLGEAVLFYKRALILGSQDPDLKSNYAYVLSQISTDSFNQSFWSRFFGKLKESAGIHFWIFIMTITNILGFIVLGLSLVWIRGRKLLLFLGSIMIALSLICGWFAFDILHTYDHGAIVVAKDTEVSFEPVLNSTVYFRLPEGSFILILDANSQWYKIKRADGKIGWILSEKAKRLKI